MAKEITAFRSKVFRTNRIDVTLKVTLEPVGPDFLQLRVRVGHRVGNRLSRSIETRQISLTGQRMGYVAVLCPIHGQEGRVGGDAPICSDSMDVVSEYRGDD